MKEKIRRAIMANFAVYSPNMKCDGQLEESVDAALAIYEKLIKGKDETLLKLADKLLKKERYKIKLQLINNHLQLCEQN